jgi:hypothetical protein
LRQGQDTHHHHAGRSGDRGGSLAENEGYGYQTVINNTLRHALLSKTGKSAGSAQLKKGITASDLKTLEKKLLDAVSEIQQLMEADIRP